MIETAEWRVNSRGLDVIGIALPDLTILRFIAGKPGVPGSKTSGTISGRVLQYTIGVDYSPI